MNNNFNNFYQSEQLSIKQAISQKLFNGNWIIGNLDGVHLGHRKLCESLVCKGEINGLITFQPHPRRFFNDNLPPFNLTDKTVKGYLLKKIGIDYIITLNFNQELSELTPKQFVEKILKPLKPKTVEIGENFFFGKDRLGNSLDLQKLLYPEVKVIIIPSLMKSKDVIYSSSLLRNALASGNIDNYYKYSHQYPMWIGNVIKGNGFGKSKLDMPTLNLELNSELLTPKAGIYIVSGSPIEMKMKPAIMYIGNRPSLNVLCTNNIINNEKRFEVHILDENINWQKDKVKIVIYKKLRNDKLFTKLKDLKSAMHNDADKARTWWKTNLSKI